MLDAGFEPPFTPLSLQPAHDAVTIDLLNDKVMRQQDVMRLALDVMARYQRKRDDWDTFADAIAALEGSLE